MTASGAKAVVKGAGGSALAALPPDARQVNGAGGDSEKGTGKMGASGADEMMARSEGLGRRSRRRPADVSALWCILRTSGPQTLKLADWLVHEAGIDAWTPRRTFKRIKGGNCVRPDGSKPTVEQDAPVLATFVFARAVHLDALEALTRDTTIVHPPFSVFHYDGKAPLVGDGAVSGLRQAEQAAAAAIRDERDAESREEAERIRITALKSEQARLRALRRADRERRKAVADMRRSFRRDFVNGEKVTVDDMPALAGMSGVIESSDGRTAIVAFGGMLTMEIEAWQLTRDAVSAEPS